MINAIALDDEPLALEILRNFCNRTSDVTLLRTFTKASAAHEYIQENPVDLLFLDINMSGISGIEFYKSVSPDIMAIFTTGYSEFAVEGFNLNAVDYLLKPFDFERFLKAIEKAKEYRNFIHKKNPGAQQYLFVKVDYSITKVPLDDILYIEGQDNYLKIYLTNGKYILVRMSMKVICQHLPENDFLRVHRSYIVPFKKVDFVRNKIAHIGNLEIPISAQYHNVVMARFGDAK